MKKILFTAFILLLSGCYNSIEDNVDKDEDTPSGNVSEYVLSTTNPSENTQEVYNYLLNLESSYLFGQANARNMSYNSTKNNDIDSSDSKDITGSHPAFIESDFMWYDNQNFENSDIDAMILHHNQGGIIGYSWHFRDSDGNFYSDSNNSSLTSDIVNDKNGGQDWFYSQIDSFALPALNRFKTLDIPVIIRPFHEMNGGWFWWGEQSTYNYIELYKLFVDYLRDTKGFNNIIYAWSPNVDFETGYYPGDNYVDIIGLDYYEPTYSKLVSELNSLVTFANEHKKLSAITETGYRKNGYGDITSRERFWTEDIMNAANKDSTTSSISYVMCWYNAKWSTSSKNAYIPYTGIGNQNVIDDFIEFKENENVIFLNEM